ncbi:phenylacetate--CoA ligase family protein [Nonomuraea basaltis]|uniref:phenylacetate--CoA ligase family protein n=1 Tax=Nonomuraea basaltis TaxID=2495887 RepID=UPI00110C62B5|nr:phenylacetate--CoA ligase family protein [Nonomuraea basaltis]TMR93586.1 phenylacetate--CoA ligase family protein [Nonomuraea basaltis]
MAYHLARIRRREHLGHAEQLQVQARLLRALVRHAYENVPYYRRLLDPALVERLRSARDLAGMPVLDRMDLHEAAAGGELLATAFTSENTRAGTTSGSSGIPITIRNSERDLGYLRASYLQDMLANGLRPTDRIAYFRVNPFLRHPLERLGVLRNFHVPTGQSLDEQVAAFLAARPTFLIGFPNVIRSVVDELQRRGIEYPSVRTVLFGGERLTPTARAHILDYFRATHREVYASVEVFTIARTCPEGKMHLRSADVVVEVEHDDGTVSVEDGEGEILVTRLHSEAMPLIRYRLGDRVRIGPNDCSCGVARTPIVREVIGRSEDRIAGADGRRFYGDFITFPVQSFPEVNRMQVIQHRPGTLEIRVVLVHGARPDVTADIRDAVLRRVPDQEVTVLQVPQIAPEPNGKIKIVKVLDPSRDPAPTEEGKAADV